MTFFRPACSPARAAVMAMAASFLLRQGLAGGLKVKGGRAGPGRRPGARGGRGEGRGPDGHLQPSGDAADPTSWAEERTPGRGPGPGSGGGPGDSGHRSLWSWITGKLRCAVRASDRRGGRWCPAPSPVRTLEDSVSAAYLTHEEIRALSGTWLTR